MSYLAKLPIGSSQSPLNDPNRYLPLSSACPSIYYKNLGCKLKIFIPFSPFSCPWPSSVRLNYNKTLCIPAPTNSIHYTGDFFTALLTVTEHKD